MGKQQDDDLFGMGGDDDDEGMDYVIIQLQPAEGWQVVMKNPFGGPNRVLGLAAFALCDMLPSPPDRPPVRVIRPMVAVENGQIEDVELFEEFVCLVAPGADVTATTAFANEVMNKVKK